MTDTITPANDTPETEPVTVQESESPATSEVNPVTETPETSETKTDSAIKDSESK
jgi:heme-binding NEAT domain protein